MENYAFIWDMDGTLVDSYSNIVPAVKEFCKEYGVDYSLEYIRDYAIRYSVGKLLEGMAPEVGEDPEHLKHLYEIRNDRAIQGISPMVHAEEILERLTKAGHQNFIYTHRGSSCFTILDETGLRPYFTEIVTSQDGFPKKPEPDGILYLLEKYKLSPENTYYVGDRSIDIESGNNAGIGTILFLQEGSPVVPGGSESYVISDLKEIGRLIGNPNQEES